MFRTMSRIETYRPDRSVVGSMKDTAGSMKDKPSTYIKNLIRVRTHMPAIDSRCYQGVHLRLAPAWALHRACDARSILQLTT